MKKISLFISIILLNSCANPDFDLTPLKYDESVNIEIAYDIKTEGNNPNDNLIFSKCNSFVFKYFVEKEGKKYLSKLISKEEFNLWENYKLIEFDSAKNELCIDRFLMFTPQEPPSNASVAPTQSLIKSYWINNDSTLFLDSSEGIIENYENLWMHPLRHLHMWPTFTAPWPYVDFPLEVGKEYTWWKKLDNGWGSKRYVKLNPKNHFDFTYKVIGTEIIEVKNKEIECFVILAKGSSQIGKTKVKYYFNPTIGFTKMDYHLMDDSRIVLYLDDYELNCDESPEVPKFPSI